MEEAAAPPSQSLMPAGAIRRRGKRSERERIERRERERAGIKEREGGNLGTRTGRGEKKGNF